MPCTLGDQDTQIELNQVLEADQEEIDDEQEVAWYLRRLDGGLFTLQTVDYILAWLAMEDDGVSHALSCSRVDINKPTLFRFGRTLHKCLIGEASP